ncbi:hypothetical protein [Phytohabitans rumicis]|uniref:Tetratricopeptide repeat protein n=1 Tax=Phytohabitans rumicis TaxID=1076125 RepID=A0A6V8LB24_9ACTN|nr:hypothetical protein [Phytohabitans rumicis]GFJ92810.1 hypothetical protein Prum_064520 [Phytohabitans rumicis]
MGEADEAVVQAATGRYAASGDPGVLQDPVAVVAAARLLLEVSRRSEQMARLGAEELRLMGTLVSWQRARAEIAPEAAEEDEWATTLAYLRLMAAADAGAIPRDLLDIARSAEEIPDLDDVGTVLHCAALPAMAVVLSIGLVDLLPELLALQRRAATVIGGQEPSRPPCLSNLALILRMHGMMLGQAEYITESVSWARLAVEAMPADQPMRFAMMANLALNLTAAAENLGPQPAEEAVTWARAAVDGIAPDSPNPALAHDALGLALLRRGMFSGTFDDLAESVDQHRRAVALTPPYAPQRGNILANLGNALLVANAMEPESADHDAGVAAFREAIDTAPDGHGDVPVWMYNEARALDQRGRFTGSAADRAAAIERMREAMALVDESRDVWAAGRALLATWSAEAHQVRGEADDPDLIRQARAALQATRRENFRWPQRASDLADLLDNRYLQTGDGAALDEAEGLLREALLRSQELGDELSRQERAELARILLRQWDHTGRPEAVAEAVELLRAVADAVEPGALLVGELQLIGGAYSAKYELTGAPDDVAAAIAAYRDALALADEGDPERAHRLDTLAITIIMRYRRDGAESDLREAVALSQEAVDTLPDGDPAQRTLLMNHAHLLGLRYFTGGDPADLSAGMEAARRASAIPLSSRTAGVEAHTSNLPQGLVEHYVRTGDLAMLNEAITVLQETLAGLPPGHPHHTGALSDLGYALQLRYQATGDQEDLSAALRVGRASVDATGPEHFQRTARVLNYLASVWARYQTSGEYAVLDDGERMAAEAVRTLPAGAPERSRLLSAYGTLLHARAERTGDSDAYADASRVRAEALEATRPGRPAATPWPTGSA